MDINEKEEFLNTHQLFKTHMDQYEVYFKNAINGQLGPTAQYWSIYFYMINRVHRNLMRAVQTNEQIDIFFG